ncbi:restriction endonuclease subunit S [Mammaliicoccus sciuri]|uniref:restriction endonuclease subunit S n=1 Tax=Mammaliicoccus sciuri TaxID=1296 RepID=UPI0034DD12BC
MEFKKYKLNEVLTLNPTLKLKKNTIAKKIAMENIKEYQKKIDSYTYSEFKSGSKFMNGDTLLARITPCLENGKTAYVDILDENEIAFGSTEFFVLRPKDNLMDSHFLYYLMRTNELRNTIIKSMTGTSGRQRAQKESILEYEFCLPSLKIQTAIAKLLKNLDDKIETNKKIIANLEEISQTLFKRWFIDFEFLDENGNPYKSSGGEMVDSELGKIPKYWKVSKLDKIASFVSRGITPKYNENSDIQIPIINQKVNKGPRLDLQYIKYFDGQNRIKKELYAQKNDLLLNSLGQGTLGRIHLFTRKSEVFLIDQHISIIRFDNINYSYFYYAHINTDLIQGQIDSLISGSTGMLMLNITKIRNLKVILPTEELVLKYSKIVNKYFGKITQLIYENENLTQLRDTLLPKLMSGEIELPDDIEVNEDELSI